MKTDLTPTPTGYANMLWAVATESTNTSDREWAKMSLISGYAETAHYGRKESQVHQETLAAEIARLNGLLNHISDLSQAVQIDTEKANDVLLAINETAAGQINAQLIADAPLLLTEVKRLGEIEQEWLMMWATLEELNLVADVRKNMTEHGFTFPTDEDVIQ